MNVIPYSLELLEPVLVSQVASGEENSALGFAFIPGSSVRGAVIAHYLKQYPSIDLTTNKQSRQWFLDGSVCFLNAYPFCTAAKARLLPTPLSWFTEKDLVADERSSLFDWAVNPEQRLEQPERPDKADFCLPDAPQSVHPEEEDEIPSLKRPIPQVRCWRSPRQVDVHIALLDPNRRGDANKVYRYDALADGEVLGGAIIASSDVELDELHALLSGVPELLIGRASTAGYGRVKLTVGPITDWEEYQPDAPPEDGSIIVTLLSDTLVRGLDGQINGDLDGVLAAMMGLEYLQAKRRYQRVRLVGGFNRKWGLPLPQAWALQAGSVYVYPAHAFDPVKLRDKARVGIGERRAEGFGRIAVNWHTAPVLQRIPHIPEPPNSPSTLTAESKALAQEIAQRRLRQRLDRKLTDYLSDVQLQSVQAGMNTQLSRVRNAVQRALSRNDVAPVIEHLGSIKAARQQFNRALVNGKPMLDWINERVNSLDVAQELLGSGRLPQVAGEKAVLDDDLKRTYTLRLIDGVMQMATKNREERP